MIHESFDASNVRALALAVIRQAIVDAKDKNEQVRDDAVSFLTEIKGPHAKAFVGWCEIAGIDPEITRDRVMICAVEQARRSVRRAMNAGGMCKPKGFKNVP